MADQSTMDRASEMTADELELYDRQIRLWGLEKQLQIKSLKVLVIGMQGLGAEIAKNLILSGVHSIVLKDHTDTSILDRCSQFLIPYDSQERNRAKASLPAAQKLNPNVKVVADSTPLEEENTSFFAKFDMVIATECSSLTYKKISQDCRNVKVKLFIADVYGLFGYFFQDVNFKLALYGEVFINSKFTTQVSKEKNGGLPLPYYLTSALLRFQNESNRKPNPASFEEDITKLKSIITFKEDSKDLIDIFDKYYRELFCELSPTTSIVGATLSQVAVSVATGCAQLEANNVFFYDHIVQEGKFHLFISLK